MSLSRRNCQHYLKQYFSNLNKHQSHLAGPLEQMAGPHPRVPDVAGRGWGLVVAFLTRSRSCCWSKDCTLRTTDGNDQVQTLRRGTYGLPSLYCPHLSPRAAWILVDLSSQHTLPYLSHLSCALCLKPSLPLDPPSSSATFLDFTMSKTQVPKMRRGHFPRSTWSAAGALQKRMLRNGFGRSSSSRCENISQKRQLWDRKCWCIHIIFLFQIMGNRPPLGSPSPTECLSFRSRTTEAYQRNLCFIGEKDPAVSENQRQVWRPLLKFIPHRVLHVNSKLPIDFLRCN